MLHPSVAIIGPGLHSVLPMPFLKSQLATYGVCPLTGPPSLAPLFRRRKNTSNTPDQIEPHLGSGTHSPFWSLLQQGTQTHFVSGLFPRSWPRCRPMSSMLWDSPFYLVLFHTWQCLRRALFCVPRWPVFSHSLPPNPFFPFFLRIPFPTPHLLTPFTTSVKPPLPLSII